MSDVPIIEVSSGINLGQFLKFANLAEDGVMARELIQGGDVFVNGQVETRRGHKLSDDALVEVDTPEGTYGARVRLIR
ncbi:RNA-binding S4 domain-containing protein [Schaalia vaccimaxillae]|uniref:RNA-binding S4 domain-containing protein n=1 Tax=Schaalia vaccimaxillae TaxID=183916 RepID=UPI0003B69D34|nr:RNA-binding S4 domain-containing protein [Schaalia vaccimaxillae]